MRTLGEVIRDRRLNRLEGDLKMLSNRLQFNPLKLTTKIKEEDITAFSDKIAEYKVWSSGDANKIREFYTNYGDYEALHYFWRNAPRTSLKKHTGIPSLIASKMGYILFGNGINIEVVCYDENGNPDEKKSDVVREEIITLYSKLEMERKLQLGASTESWCGHVFYKLSIDNTLSNYPIMEVADITQGRVVKQRGIVKAIVFPKYYKEKDKNYRLDEIYSTTDKGDACISYKLYKLNVAKGTEDAVPLTTLLDTAKYAEKDFIVFDGIKGILAFEKPNKSSLLFSESDYGASDYEGAIDSFDAMDEAYTNIFKELRTNRTVRYIPKDMIPKSMNGEFALNDDFTDAYVQIESDVDQNSKNEITFSMIPDKTESHKAKFLTALTTALNKAGLSPYAIGITGLESVNASAESQQERNKVTLETRKAKMSLWKPFIEEMLIKILELNDWLVKNKLVEQDYKDNGIKWEDIEIQVSFGDYIVETENSIIGQAINKLGAGIASTETAIKEIHPDWTDEQVMEEVNKIRYEKGMALDTPDALPELTGIVNEEDNEG